MNEKPTYEELALKINELEKDNESLRSSVTNYKDLYDNAPDMSVSVDANTAKIINCNQTVINQLGYSKDEIIGRSIFDMYTRSSAKIAREKVFPVFVEKGKIDGVELQLQRKDGSVLDVSLNVSSAYDENGEIIHSRSVWRDITKRKQTEEALKESEARYRKVVDTMLDGLVISDKDGKLKFVNSAFCDIYQYTQEELIGMYAPQVIHPDFHHVFRQFVKELEETGQFSGETVDVRKDGTTFDSDVRGSKILFKGQECLLAVIRDVSERKRAEEALRKAEDLFRAAVKNSPIAMIVSSGVENKVLNINRKFIELFGYDKIDIPDVSAWWPLAYPDPLYRKEIQEMWTKEMERASSEQSGVGPFDVTIKCKDNSKKQVSVQASPVDDKRFITFVDLTELKAAEKEREKLIEDQKKALEEIKTLRGIIPICANCKKIRDDKGYWNQIESYIQKHSDAEFSHGICPECVKKLYPELDVEA